MRTFLTSENGNFVFGAGGNLSIVTGLEAISVASRHFAKTQRAEMIHAMDSGIPFFETVFSPSGNAVQYEAALRARLLQVPGVEAVENLDITQEGDVLRYTATLRANGGSEVVVDG